MVALIAALATLAACAQATGPDQGGDDDDVGGVDAAADLADAQPELDAPAGRIDAQPPPPPADAEVPPPPIDAAIAPGIDAGSGLFCNGNADCPAPDDCCLYLIMPPGLCVPGTELGDACIPDTT